jgi:hypothetical protein
MLDRDRAAQYSAAQLHPYLQVLQDLVDEGTWIIRRCLEASQRSSRDIVILCIFCKQVVSMLDATVELLKAGCVYPSQLELRAAFEAHIYVDWLLKRKTKWRSLAYLVAELRNELYWAKRLRVGTPEYEKCHAIYEATYKLTGGKIPDEDQNMVQQQIEDLETRLNEHPRRSLNRRFEKLKKKIGHDPNWYAVLFPRKCGRPSLRTLASQVDRLDEYDLVYERGSRVTHGTMSKSHVRIAANRQMTIVPLREPADFAMAAQQMVAIVLALYVDVLEAYKPGEAKWFVEQYRERWRPVLQTLSSIERPRVEIQNID